MPPLLDLVSVTKRFGGLVANKDVSFAIEEHDIVGLIGPNGAGKTTLFRMLVGQEPPDAGSIEIGDTVAASGGPPTPEQAQRLAHLGAEIQKHSKIDIVLLFIAVIAMATARYW